MMSLSPKPRIQPLIPIQELPSMSLLDRMHGIRKDVESYVALLLVIQFRKVQHQGGVTLRQKSPEGEPASNGSMAGEIQPGEDNGQYFYFNGTLYNRLCMNNDLEAAGGSDFKGQDHGQGLRAASEEFVPHDRRQDSAKRSEKAIPEIYGICLKNPNFQATDDEDEEEEDEKPAEPKKVLPPKGCPHLRGVYTLLMQHRWANAEAYGLIKPHASNNCRDQEQPVNGQALVVTVEPPSNAAATNRNPNRNGDTNPSGGGEKRNKPAGQQRRQGRPRPRGVTEMFGLYAQPSHLPATRLDVQANKKATQAVKSLFGDRPVQESQRGLGPAPDMSGNTNTNSARPGSHNKRLNFPNGPQSLGNMTPQEIEYQLAQEWPIINQKKFKNKKMPRS